MNIRKLNESLKILLGDQSLNEEKDMYQLIKTEFNDGRGIKKYKQAKRYKVVVDYPSTGYGTDDRYRSRKVTELKARAEKFGQENNIEFKYIYHPNYGYLQLQFFLPLELKRS